MTSISKNVYIDKLDDIVNEYNNTYRIIKMKVVHVRDDTYLDLNFKLVIMLEYQNRKIFLLKAILQIGLKKFL